MSINPPHADLSAFVLFSECKHLSVSSPLKINNAQNDVTDEKLVSFVVTYAGQLIAVYNNNNETTTIKMKSILNLENNEKWLYAMRSNVSVNVSLLYSPLIWSSKS